VGVPKKTYQVFFVYGGFFWVRTRVSEPCNNGSSGTLKLTHSLWWQ